MPNIGYSLSSEEFGPNRLVELVKRAEDAGFGFRIHLRPLPPLDPPPGSLPFRVAGDWRHRSGNPTFPTGYRCDMSPDKNTSGDHRPSRGDGILYDARTFHAGPWNRRKPERACNRARWPGPIEPLAICCAR